MTLIVRTVLGDIAPARLGFTLPHEHLITCPPKGIDPDCRLDDVGKAIAEVQLFQRAGGGAIAELSTHGYGRDVRGLQEISRASGVHIVSATGYIMQSYFPPEALQLAQEQLAELFVREVRQGVDGSDARAGVIKCGSSQDAITAAEAKVMRAAAQAHLACGAPISTHTSGGSMAFAQIELFKSEGVPLNRVIIGHLDCQSLQADYLTALAREGAYVQLDKVGRTKYYPDSLRVQVIQELIAAGFVERILLSGDNGRKSYFLSWGGGPGLAYIPATFAPMLRAAGVREEHIRQMTLLNPRAALSFEPR